MPARAGCEPGHVQREIGRDEVAPDVAGEQVPRYRSRRFQRANGTGVEILDSSRSGLGLVISQRIAGLHANMYWSFERISKEGVVSHRFGLREVL